MFWYYHTYVLQINLLSSSINIAKKSQFVWMIIYYSILVFA